MLSILDDLRTTGGYRYRHTYRYLLYCFHAMWNMLLQYPETCAMLPPPQSTKVSNQYGNRQ